MTTVNSLKLCPVCEMDITSLKSERCFCGHLINTYKSEIFGIPDYLDYQAKEEIDKLSKKNLGEKEKAAKEFELQIQLGMVFRQGLTHEDRVALLNDVNIMLKTLRLSTAKRDEVRGILGMARIIGEFAAAEEKVVALGGQCNGDTVNIPKSEDPDQDPNQT